MHRLELRLFGGFQTSYQGNSLIFSTDKTRGLLAYLALNAHTPLLRPSLATLFFPNYPDTQARKNLNLTLTRLRQGLEAVQTNLPASMLTADYQTVQMNWDNTYCWADVLEFDDLLRRCEHHIHERFDQCKTCMQWLKQAADLYQGDFLQGLSLNGCNEFDEWRLWQSEIYRQRTLWVLDILAEYTLETADYSHAQQYARRQIELMPWQERAHRQLIQALVFSGHRAAALAQYEVCCQILQEELGTEPETATTALIEQIQQGLFHANTRETGLPSRQLPALVTSFVGRSHELSRLQNYLQQPDHRLITLVGMGGVGKTWLAICAAWLALPLFHGKVYFIPLVDIPAEGDAADIQHRLMMAIAQVLQMERMEADPLRLLGDALHDKNLLLVLDNFEHLLAGGTAVSQLLKAAPGLKVLVTSRERLNLTGEWVVSLEGLNYPPVPLPEPDWGEKPVPRPEAMWQTPDGMERLAVFEAVQLLIQRIKQVAPDFELELSNAAEVARLCQLVEGLPLGLELAAGQIGVLGLEDVVTAVASDLERLSAELRDLPPRHRSLQVVFEQSWRMLQPAEQKSLTYLAVFGGGFTAVAAQAVANVDWKQLLALTQKAFIRPSAVNGRYEMHELLRQFATAKLDKKTNICAHNAHSSYYLALATQHQPALFGADPLPATKTLRAELDNLRRAFQWAIQREKYAWVDPALESLVRFYEVTGFAREAEELFAQAHQEKIYRPENGRFYHRIILARANSLLRLGQYEPAIELIKTRLETMPAELTVYAYDYLAELYLRRGLPQRSQEYTHLALKLAREAQELRIEALNLRRLDMLANYTTTYQEQALIIIRQLGDRWLEAFVLNSLGGSHMYHGNYSKARACWEEALEYASKMGNRYTCASLQNNLGDTHRQLGNYETAEQYFEQALKTYRSLGNERLTMSTLEGVSRLHFHLGNYDYALAAAQEGYNLAHQGGTLGVEVCTLSCIGHIYTAQRDWKKARAAYEQAYVAGHQELMSLMPECRAGLAFVCLQENNLAEAMEHIETVLWQLTIQKPEGAMDPGLIYLRSYQVLATAGDERAMNVLVQAGQWLADQVSQIDDENGRHRFLQGISEHNELLKLIHSQPVNGLIIYKRQ